MLAARSSVLSAGSAHQLIRNIPSARRVSAALSRSLRTSIVHPLPFQDPHEAILSATSLAAESLELGDSIGALEKGMVADLIAVDGNPLDDMTALRRVVFVMKDAKVVKNQRWRGCLSTARATSLPDPCRRP